MKSLLALLLATALGCHGLTVEPGAPARAGTGTIVRTALDEDTRCPPLPAEPHSIDRTARPPFFEVSGGRGATLELLGTIHLGPRDGWSFSPAIHAALARSDRFVMELDFRRIDDDEVASVLAARVVLPQNVVLDDVVSEETRALLRSRDDSLAALGLPKNARKRLDPWYLSVGLAEAATTRSGFPMSASADGLIVSEIGDRPLVGLETFDEQLALLDELPPELQDAMLLDTLRRLDELDLEVLKLIRAWASSDESCLTAIAYQGADDSPELERFYDLLLGARNRRWVERVRPWLENPALRDQTLFMAVGALHLVGPDSLVKLFRDAGYRVEAIDHDEGDRP